MIDDVRLRGCGAWLRTRGFTADRGADDRAQARAPKRANVQRWSTVGAAAAIRRSPDWIPDRVAILRTTDACERRLTVQQGRRSPGRRRGVFEADRRDRWAGTADPSAGYGEPRGMNVECG
jgi:hypothetical protein